MRLPHSAGLPAWGSQHGGLGAGLRGSWHGALGTGLSVCGARHRGLGAGLSVRGSQCGVCKGRQEKEWPLL